MSTIDWLVLAITLLFIVGYGIWKSRHNRNIEGYLLADKQIPWYGVGLSVMATQASAITFLSAPGQAYSDGLRFVQFYFGLPLAMIVVCATFIPIFQRLNVFTAYEYLERRFDVKTRSLTAFLFLLQRGLSTGITIYAPSIILSAILQVDIRYTTVLMGVLVILYTVYGGTRAVSYTQMLQMAIIFSGLALAGYMVVHLMPENVGFLDALHLAGKLGRANAIDTKFDLNNRYNIWSGIIGGFFLQLSYFGTDQSQVGRYLTGKSIAESRLGLVMNGLLKIPMQFLILLIGTLVFAFYQFHPAPVFFNPVAVAQVEASPYNQRFQDLKAAQLQLHEQKKIWVEKLIPALHQDDPESVNQISVHLRNSARQEADIRDSVAHLMQQADPNADTNDSNYVFLTFVTHYLPVGMVGLLIAIIFLAAMGSTASGLNSLASATVVDFYKRFLRKEGSEGHYLSASRWATIGWGLFCMVVALYAGQLGNLIEAVNILGSLFYGTILGIFLTAFFLKKVNGSSVFVAALVAELAVVAVWLAHWMAFLWLNVLGCLLVLILAWLLQQCRPRKSYPVQTG
ncbi:MAG: sodium:solute symporter [Bacteroidetes bacterium]|nr:sodium:solute symporter [Bacteroidota bacterium]MBS1630521.1 sodium:solute symporter [Bacteroidota bacterium]